MSTMELRASLLKEVAAIITDDDLTAEALQAIKALRRKSIIVCKDKEAESPCNYSTEYVKERAVNALKRYKQGEYASQDEILERTKQWE